MPVSTFLVSLLVVSASGTKDLQSFFQSESDMVARSSEAAPADAHTKAAATPVQPAKSEEIPTHLKVSIDEEDDAKEGVHMKFETLSTGAADHITDAKAELDHAAAVDEAVGSSVGSGFAKTSTKSVDAPEKPDLAPPQLRASALPKLQVKYTISNATAGHLVGGKLDEETNHFLAEKGVPMGEADACSCEFKGLCLCENAIEFMDCVSAKCSSGQCDCHEQQFIHACGSIADVCLQDPANGVLGIDMQCTADRAACLVEENAQLSNVERTKDTIYAELTDLKEKKCRLEIASDDGWLNAQKQLEYVKEEIKSRNAELADMGAPLPEMHCEKHFQEWDNQHVPTDAPAPAPAPKSAAVALQASAVVALLAIFSTFA